jgi:hypothetical protein
VAGGGLKRAVLDRLAQWPSFSADGRHLAFVSNWNGNPDLYFWDLRRGEEAALLPEMKRYTHFAEFAPDGRTLAVIPTSRKGGQEAEIQLWDLKDRKLRTTLKTEPRAYTSKHPPRNVMPLPGLQVGSLTFSADGRVLASRDNSNRVTVWDASGAIRAQWQGDKNDRATVALSPDGNLAACFCPLSGYRITVWETATGEEVLAFRGGAGDRFSYYRLAFLPDRRLLSMSASEGCALVWDPLGAAEAGESDGAIGAKEADKLWEALDQPGAAGFRAVSRLVRAGRSGFDVLRGRVRPAPARDAGRTRRLVGELDADAAADRDRATGELERLGELAEPELRKALTGKPSAEVKRSVERLLARLASPLRIPGRLRQSRSVLALEWIGTAEAKALLRNLAAGEPVAALTQDARAALQRLDRHLKR